MKLSSAKTKEVFSYTTILLVLFVIAAIPLLTHAQLTYQPLVGIPGVSGTVTGANTTFSDYVNAIYALSISLAGLLAVIKIVIGGIKWMTTDVVTTKGEAKKDIQGALIGLLIVLSAVLIISTINPNITNTTNSLTQHANATAVASPVTTTPPPSCSGAQANTCSIVPCGSGGSISCAAATANCLSLPASTGAIPVNSSLPTGSAVVCQLTTPIPNLHAGMTVTPGMIVGSAGVQNSTIATMLGQTGISGNTENDLMAQYLNGSITIAQLGNALGTTIPTAQHGNLNNMRSTLGCTSQTAVGWHQVGTSVTFYCIN